MSGFNKYIGYEATFSSLGTSGGSQIVIQVINHKEVYSSVLLKQSVK